MKYTPKELKGNVNISHTSPIKEFFILLSGILGILFIIYLALGFAVDLVASKLPFEVEHKLGSLYSSLYNNTESTEAGKNLQELLDDLVRNTSNSSDLKTQNIKYNVHLIPGPIANAMALPGGIIIVFSPLMDEVKSENEIAFVLAHELGHYANRDHLRGLGRRLVLIAASATLLGGDSSVTNFLISSMVNIEMKFSQHQETTADLWALDLLNNKYGHVAGAMDFFDTLSTKEDSNRISYYFATHPYPDDRIKQLEKRIAEKRYLLQEKIPLNYPSNTDAGTR